MFPVHLFIPMYWLAVFIFGRAHKFTLSQTPLWYWLAKRDETEDDDDDVWHSRLGRCDDVDVDVWFGFTLVLISSLDCYHVPHRLPSICHWSDFLQFWLINQVGNLQFKIFLLLLLSLYCEKYEAESLDVICCVFYSFFHSIVICCVHKWVFSSLLKMWQRAWM